MYKRILLCTDGSPAADVAAEYSIWLAEKFSAGMVALYITDIRLLEGPWLADLAGAVGAQPYAALVPQLENIQREKADAIHTAVQKKCQQHNIPCELIHDTGSLVSTMLRHEQRADIVVLGQHGEHAQWSHGMLGSGVERILRASLKPALVTPDSFRPIQRILIAYDGSSGARRALQDGLELAQRLGCETTLLTACQNTSEDVAAGFLREARQEAETRQINAHAQLAHGDAEVAILHWTLQTKADLIVMGAYGHTRIREFILGSTTQQVLQKATVPVLLARGQS
ncbi:MAG: universal stress protein [Verrucomicrobia bacterium]|nr:universal stress protein [Verrucomicrobiota bacterium]